MESVELGFGGQSCVSSRCRVRPRALGALRFGMLRGNFHGRVGLLPKNGKDLC